MFEARSSEPLTKEFVLSRITEEDVFLKYLNIYPTITQRYKNPLRDDAHADCVFYRDSRGTLKFKDFAYRMNLDCFNVVMITNQLNYGQALKKISDDFKLYDKDIDYSVVANWEEAISTASKKLCIINVKRKEFTKDELKWWFEQGIHKEVLSFYKVSSLQMLWLNGNVIYSYSKSDPGFVYHFGDYNYKAYFPFRKEYRFIQNISRSTFQGYDQLPEIGRYLVITQSLKCAMCISTFDIASGAPTTETILIGEELFIELQSRFTFIFTLFDRWKDGKIDKAGTHMSWLMRKKYNTIPLFFEKENPKDFCDNYKKYGSIYMGELIEEIKQKYE